MMLYNPILFILKSSATGKYYPAIWSEIVVINLLNTKTPEDRVMKGKCDTYLREPFDTMEGAIDEIKNILTKEVTDQICINNYVEWDGLSIPDMEIFIEKKDNEFLLVT